MNKYNNKITEDEDDEENHINDNNNSISLSPLSIEPLTIDTESTKKKNAFKIIHSIKNYINNKTKSRSHHFERTCGNDDDDNNDNFERYIYLFKFYYILY